MEEKPKTVLTDKYFYQSTNSIHEAQAQRVNLRGGNKDNFPFLKKFFLKKSLKEQCEF